MKQRSISALITAAAALAACLLISGCGGGGSTSPGLITNGSGSQSSLSPTQFTRTGTFRFNLLPVAALTIQDDSGSILTPVNPPLNAVEGERIQFTFVMAVNPTFVRPMPQPIELLSILRL